MPQVKLPEKRVVLFLQEWALHRVGRDIAERENVIELRELKSWFDDEQSTLVFSASSCSTNGLIFTPPVQTTPEAFNSSVFPDAQK